VPHDLYSQFLLVVISKSTIVGFYYLKDWGAHFVTFVIVHAGIELILSTPSPSFDISKNPKS
jgi:hypothetical protein